MIGIALNSAAVLPAQSIPNFIDIYISLAKYGTYGPSYRSQMDAEALAKTNESRTSLKSEINHVEP